VKFIEFDGKDYLFEFGERERQWFFEILGRYPFIPISHHQLSKSPDEAESEANQKLLEEALAEQRAENKRHVQAMLHDPGRFERSESITRFRLNSGESEWLLQILNDVRVGCWIQLGQPAETKKWEVDVSSEAGSFIWAMELCGYFQAVLLESLNG